MIDLLGLLAVGLAAYFVGQFVTDVLCRAGGWWAQPAGAEWRRANFPLGGLIFGGLALYTGEPILWMIAFGFTLAAVSYRA